MVVPYRSGHSQRKSKKYQSWDGNIQNLMPLGHGVSGMVLAIDDLRVAKVDIGSPRSIQDIETEREAYRKLSTAYNRYVLLCFEIDNPSGLVLERCRDTVRRRLRSMGGDFPSRDELITKWAYQAAEGLAHIHRCGIVQGDVGCHNMLLDSTDTLKLADFAGSSINGSPATVDYEVRSKLPGIGEPTELSDVFALGSAMFEMVTGSPPYAELSWREVHGLYKRGRYLRPKSIPEFKSMPYLAQIIENCWQQKSYRNAQDVVDDVDDMILQHYPSVDSAISVSDLQQSFDTLWKPSRRSPPDREAPITYVHHTSSNRRRSRRYELDTDRGGEIQGYRKEKKKQNKNPVSEWFVKSLSWSKASYTSQARASTYY